jgi:hypothetical protein
MRVFATRAFGQFARKEKINTAMLCDAIDRAGRGLVDADLGGCVIKQRVARTGRGRSGGYRTLIALRTQTRAVFLLGFAKNDKGNIEPHELKELRKTASEMLTWDANQVAKMLAANAWTEIDCNGEEVQK